MNNFEVAIPTYNRADDLQKCLDSLINQTKSPKSVYIIDDGELTQSYIFENQKIFENLGIDFKYTKKNENKGTSESRNLALDISREEILFILDDDVILDPDFFEKVMQVWDESKTEKLIGVGGVIKSSRIKSHAEKLYNTFFGLDSDLDWDVNDVGFQVWDDRVLGLTKGYYFHGGGGACSYRRKLTLELGGFTSFGSGRSALEDVDFCLRAKRAGYHVLIEPQARVFHKQSSVSREKSFLTGKKESINRKEIFRKNCPQNFKHQLVFVWANFGWILRQFLAGHVSKGLGMAYGFLLKH